MPASPEQPIAGNLPELPTMRVETPELSAAAQVASLHSDRLALPTLPAGSSPWVVMDGHPERLQFHGQWTAYWRIWIVNIALTILTLGIYSAWAKVRTKRWFYGNVELAGSRFAYHGQPLPILKGRLIMAGLVITWLVCTQLGPGWVLGALIAFVLVLPWLVARAAAFRAWNSSWRGLRFSFDGSVGHAFLVYALPLLGLAFLIFLLSTTPGAGGGSVVFVLIVFGVFTPFVLTAQRRYLVTHHRFGQERFTFDGSGLTLLGIYFVAGMLLLLLRGAATPLEKHLLPAAAQRLYWLLASWKQVWMVQNFQYLAPLLLAPVILLVSLPGLFGLGYLRGRSSRWQWEHTRLGGVVRFENRLNPWELAAHYFVNGGAIALSLGLLIPWAVVRTAKLRAESMMLWCQQPLDEFAAGKAEPVGATGDEVGELMGLDVGI